MNIDEKIERGFEGHSTWSYCVLFLLLIFFLVLTIVSTISLIEQLGGL